MFANTRSSGAAGLIKAVKKSTFLAIPVGGVLLSSASCKISVWWIACKSLKYVLINLGSTSDNKGVVIGV